jgi:hypothetical protein
VQQRLSGKSKKDITNLIVGGSSETTGMPPTLLFKTHLTNSPFKGNLENHKNF